MVEIVLECTINSAAHDTLLKQIQTKSDGQT